MSKNQSIKDFSWIDQIVILSGWALLIVPFMIAEIIALLRYPLQYIVYCLEICCMRLHLHTQSMGVHTKAEVGKYCRQQKK